MKQSSKKLLLWLYPTQLDSGNRYHRRRVPYAQVPIILPELSEDGRQSLIRLLENNQLLHTDQLTGELNLSLSSHGKSQLEAQLPLLKRQTDPWQGDWQMIIFLEPPQSDPNFRYLRTLLLKEHCFALKRGVYIYPGQISERLTDILHKTYRNAVMVIRYDIWSFGDELKIIGQKTDLDSRVDIYSGISTELKKLLTKKLNCKTLTNQQKKAIYSVYDRLYINFEEDVGLMNHYFPQVEGGFQLLCQLKDNIE
jgi:DNA-binding transcriptional regulator PaaX